MDLEKIDKDNTSIIKYSKTDNVLNDICMLNNKFCKRLCISVC